MIKAKIDSVSHKDSHYSVSGWAYKLDGKDKIPVDSIVCQSEQEYRIDRIERQDFGCEIGFILYTNSLKLVIDIVFNAIDVTAFSSGFCEKIVVGPRAKAQFFCVLSSDIDDVHSPLLLQSIMPKVARFMKNKHASEIATTSGFNLDVGSRTYCNSVVVGLKGFLFLVGGSNNLEYQYECPPDNELLNSWCQLIEERAKIFDSLNIKYLNFIIPEKQSVLTDEYPGEISCCTPLLSGITDRLGGKEFFFDAYGYMRSKYIEGSKFYRKLDSHLSYIGNLSILEAVLSKLNININSGDLFAGELSVEKIPGDLSNRFCFGQMKEEHLIGTDKLNNPEVVYSYSPEGGHQRSHYHWKNDNPLVNKKVIIFGNSMFERGDSATGLSYWFSRIFSETVFYWSKSVEMSLVNEFKPDVVITQTVERFLMGIPEDNLI
ncbi:hypothetical protein GT360_13560 [Vibrio astriarenae]|uniref:AlgX/AlgJ SGNH hydrolase-like domain-containing protein n=1 Tax=Vibrio astriarenae TaxID=1481923 RepID=A0A7Z2T4W3_9VIBR|nr:hypothetical protein [Vibrio astriarenae]QIA64454.1 hypothetical protein GT360_13560 [Vibrio astriarenae]